MRTPHRDPSTDMPHPSPQNRTLRTPRFLWVLILLLFLCGCGCGGGGGGGTGSWPAPSPSVQDNYAVHHMDVEEGDSTLIVSQTKEACVIDAGRRADLGKKVGDYHRFSRSDLCRTLSGAELQR